MDSSTDVTAALIDFVTRIDALDPSGPTDDLVVRMAGREHVLPLREPVARALVAALRDYHDPRDLGACDHCGGPRLDHNFLCRDCGRPNGVFGQMLVERAARYVEPEALT